MNEWRVKLLVGFYLIGIQCALVGVAIYEMFIGGLLFQQFTTILGFVVPLFSGYISVIVKFFVTHRYLPRLKTQRQISAPFAVLSLFFPTLFGAFLGGCIVLAGKNMFFRDFDDVKTAIGLAEAAFGVYIGQFVFTLFEGAAEVKEIHAGQDPGARQH
jgi:hypothetical protein